MSNTEYVSVTELNRYLYHKLEQDVLLQQVYLEGELSNCKRSGNHYYFSLKDQTSEISGMFFYPANLSLAFVPSDGMSVQVVGKVQIYQKRGTYAIIVSKMTECGVGILYQKYLQLKEKLDREGLFLESHKMRIPEYPETVGIITAATGEAINDIISTFNRRLPLAQLILYPAIVQGTDAPKDLIRALDLAYRNSSIDCLIIGRGGGSFEDLNCFNDEALARKLYDAPFPTISAVGHEGDYTICDFVCSFRAPTPTGAAMALTKVKADIAENLLSISKRLTYSIKNKLITSFNMLKKCQDAYGLAHFDEVLNQKEQLILDLNKRLRLLTPEQIAINLENKINEQKRLLNIHIEQIIKEQNNQLENLVQRLRVTLITDKIETLSEKIKMLSERIDKAVNDSINKNNQIFEYLVEKSMLLNPLNIINKGYAIVLKNHQMIYSVNELATNDVVNLKFRDGNAKALIQEIEE